MYLLVLEQIDFFRVFGIYDDYIKAQEDYFNLKKYLVFYSEDKLCLYALDVNKFYKDEEFEQIL